MLQAWNKVHYVTNPEYKIPVRLKCIDGKLPVDVKGTYYKNTPHPRAGQFFLDGDGQVSKYTIRNGQVYYSSRNVTTTHVAQEQLLGRWLYTGAFGSKGIIPFIKNISNTNIILWGERLLSFYEGGAPYELDATTLHTRGLYKDFLDGWPLSTGNRSIDVVLKGKGIIGDAVCAHPKVIDDRLVMAAQQYTVGGVGISTHVTFYEIDSLHEVKSRIECVVDGFNYFHDFLVTDDYYIFHKHNYVVDWGNITGVGIANALTSSNSETDISKFIMVKRNTGKVEELVVPGNFWISHYVSSGSAGGGCKNIEFVQYQRYINLSDVCAGKSISRGYLTRVTYDARGKFVDIRKANTWIEFPVRGKLTGHAYATGGHSNPQEGIYHIQDGCVTDKYVPGGRKLFSEPFLVGDLVGALCYDDFAEKTTLLFLKRESLSRGPIAVFEYPNNIVSLGLHGNA